jgi:D-methionine transport system substrate-binding protein
MNSKLLGFVLGSCLVIGGILYFSASKPKDDVLKVGVTAGPHAMIMAKIKEVAAKANFKIDIVEFNDFVQPNEALHQGEIDVNSFQHGQFLDSHVKDRGYKIASVVKTVLMPIGIYSKKIKDVHTLKTGAKVGIPNDPTNGSRALLLLQKAGLIELKEVLSPTVLDVLINPKKIKIVEIEAPHLPRSMEDLDLAVINTDWVVLAGMDPKKALMTEDKESPYANVIAVKKGNESDPRIKKLIEIYHSEPVKKYIESQFKGNLIPLW